MRSRGRRTRPAAVKGRGWGLSEALLAVLMASALWSGTVATARAQGSSSSTSATADRKPLIYHRSRNFRIPFHVDATGPALKEVQLFVSEDSGYKWTPASRTTPDRPVFSFRSSHDGEYWFAVRTIDQKGRMYPAKDEPAEPNMKVVVDTTPPALVLEPNGRRGSMASVRWDVKDENLDLKTLVLEYQVAGGRDWRSLPIERRSLIGREDWDAGTAEPLKVRGSVADKAGNVADVVINLGEGTAAPPSSTVNEPPELAAPPISQISTGQTFAPQSPPVTAAPGPRVATDPFAGMDAPHAASESAAAPAPAPLAPAAIGSGAAALFANEPAAAPAVDPAAASAAAAANPAVPPELVSSPRFPLQYKVDDAGPEGPSKVELWVTKDGGRSWANKGEDADRSSPFLVDLGGEGTFGLRLVSRSATGLGDPPPGPGDPPEIMVEVDSTPPTVQILPVKLGSGQNLGKVAISWRASDVHLASKSATLSWRLDQPGAAWQPIAQGLDSNGEFVWNVPSTVPSRFHLRVDVVDEAGNRGYAETSEGAPVIVDRTRPRTKILGLDPSAARASARSRGRCIKHAPIDRVHLNRRAEQILDGVALGDQLRRGGVEPLSGVVVDRQAGDDLTTICRRRSGAGSCRSGRRECRSCRRRRRLR